MTRNKAQKSATRHRMAQTGEPYSVARKATDAGPDDPGDHETPQERYLREAQEAGVSAEDIDALRLGFQAQDWADEDEQRLVTERADKMQRAADQARDRADQAEEAADEAEGRADAAADWAHVEQELAGEEQFDEVDAADRWRDTWPAGPRVPRPPRPSRPPRLPRPPRFP